MENAETQPTRVDFYAELRKFLETGKFDGSNTLGKLFEATQPSISRIDLTEIHVNYGQKLRLRIMAAAYRDLYSCSIKNECIIILKRLHELLAREYPYFVWAVVTDDFELDLGDSAGNVVGAKASMIMENTPGGIFEEYFLNPNNFELFVEKDLQQGVWIKRR